LLVVVGFCNGWWGLGGELGIFVVGGGGGGESQGSRVSQVEKTRSYSHRTG